MSFTNFLPHQLRNKLNHAIYNNSKVYLLCYDKIICKRKLHEFVNRYYLSYRLEIILNIKFKFLTHRMVNTDWINFIHSQINFLLYNINSNFNLPYASSCIYLILNLSQRINNKNKTFEKIKKKYVFFLNKIPRNTKEPTNKKFTAFFSNSNSTENYVSRST